MVSGVKSIKWGSGQLLLRSLWKASAPPARARRAKPGRGIEGGPGSPGAAAVGGGMSLLRVGAGGASAQPGRFISFARTGEAVNIQMLTARVARVRIVGYGWREENIPMKLVCGG